MGLTAAMLKIRDSDARMNAPATRPVMYGYRTMSTLHCSSTSFGYMKPCTPGAIFAPLPHRPVQVLVIDLCARGHVRLENLHVVVAQERMHRVGGVLQVGQLARARGTGLAARRGESF